MILAFSLEYILEEIYKMHHWLNNEININTTNSKFEEIYNNIKVIIPIMIKSGVDPLKENFKSEDVWFSLLEAGSFVRIYQTFKTFKSSDIPRKALKDSISGPLIPYKENAITSHARNILFELELASVLHTYGHNVTGFDDVQLSYAGKNVRIECKKPFSEKSIGKNLLKAQDQIRKKHVLDSYNFIAFSIDKIINTEKRILFADTYDIAFDTVGELAIEFSKKYEKLWRNIDNISIICVVIYTRFFYKIKEDNAYGLGNFVYLYNREISRNSSLFVKMISDHMLD